jgi:hypothetical protein
MTENRNPIRRAAGVIMLVAAALNAMSALKAALVDADTASTALHSIAAGALLITATLILTSAYGKKEEK